VKIGDLVKINVKKLKENGRVVMKTELKNPFGFIIKSDPCKSTSLRVILTETGEKFWYPREYLEVIDE
tara:strand:+ start:147 stop:350 length:204 start_codon:yes stop_codon:yes gene_type:complete